MAAALYKNNATATMSSGISSTATSLTVTSGQGALFPAATTGGNYFYATLIGLAGTIEIVKVTNRATDTFTIVRGQDDTTAATFSTGAKVELRVVAAGLNEKFNTSGGTISGDVTVTGTVDATEFTGPLTGDVTGNLTGDVTGNVSGSSGSCTGNAATATLATTATTATTATSATTATTATYASTVTDTSYAIGYLQIPQSSNTTPDDTDVGKHLYISSGVTIDPSVFSVGDSFVIVNSSSSSFTITAGTGVTLRLSGSATTGNRTLSGYGMASLVCVVGGATPTFMVSGAGVS